MCEHSEGATKGLRVYKFCIESVNCFRLHLLKHILTFTIPCFLYRYSDIALKMPNFEHQLLKRLRIFLVTGLSISPHFSMQLKVMAMAK